MKTTVSNITISTSTISRNGNSMFCSIFGGRNIDDIGLRFS